RYADRVRRDRREEQSESEDQSPGNRHRAFSGEGFLLDEAHAGEAPKRKRRLYGAAYLPAVPSSDTCCRILAPATSPSRAALRSKCPWPWATRRRQRSAIAMTTGVVSAPEAARARSRSFSAHSSEKTAE